MSSKDVSCPRTGACRGAESDSSRPVARSQGLRFAFSGALVYVTPMAAQASCRVLISQLPRWKVVVLCPRNTPQCKEALEWDSSERLRALVLSCLVLSRSVMFWASGVLQCVYYCWSWVLPEKLTGPQLVQKFPAFYGTRKFTTVFTRARHLSLFWARSIHSMPPHFPSRRFILVFFSHLRLRLPSDILFLRISFLTQRRRMLDMQNIFWQGTVALVCFVWNSETSHVLTFFVHNEFILFSFCPHLSSSVTVCTYSFMKFGRNRKRSLLVYIARTDYV